MRIACVGGGPGGLYLSILLSQPGSPHEVTIFERDAEGSAAGWGLTLMDGFLEELEVHDPPTARAVREAAVTWDGQVVERSGHEPVAGPAFGHSIRRSALVAALTQRARQLGVTVHDGHAVTDAAELSGYDLVVAADGVTSALRTQQATAFGTVLDRRPNVFAWLGTTKEYDTFRFSFVRSEAGWAWVGAHTFDEGLSGFIVEMAPSTWEGLGLDVASSDEVLATLERVFARELDGHRLLPQSGPRGPVPWQRFTRVTNERWHVGNLVLLGDAAHTTHFSIGSGTRLAMGDAIVLAEVLLAGGPLEAALEEYGSRRREAVAPIAAEAFNSVQWFENLERYVGTDPRHFALLYNRRRTSMHRRMPVRLYLALSDAAAATTPLSGWAASLAGWGVRTLLSVRPGAASRRGRPPR